MGPFVFKSLIHFKILFYISFLLCFIGSKDSLFSTPELENWDTYQDRILQEHPNFSGWCPKEKAKRLMNIILNNKSDICVEVGVYGGSSFFPVISTLAYKGEGKGYAIDPWSNEMCLEGYEKETDEKIYNYWGKIDLNKTLYKFIEDMHRNNLDPFYIIMRSSSAQTHPFFADNSIDFLHIDGNHSEQASVYDVEHWLPKVKSGGIICFDDAWWKSTQMAIQLLLKECEIMKKESSEKWQYIFLRKL